MLQEIAFPPKYIQGPDALKEIGHYVEKLGKKALLVGDETSLALAADTIRQSLHDYKVECAIERFCGECTLREISRVASAAKKAQSSVIIALGGGKVIDTSRAAAFQCGCKLVTAPTTVANTAAISSTSVVYTESHIFDVELEFPENPNLVIVDTGIIVTAPSHYLTAGIGDALAAFYEGDACMKSKAQVVNGGMRTHTIAALTAVCKETLFTYGVDAKLSCEAKVVTPSFERVIEAILLMAGLSFEGPSCAVAHAVNTGMLNTFEELQPFKHGEIIAFTTLVEIVLGQYPADEVKQYVRLTDALGLPVCLKDFNIDSKKDADRLRQAAERACNRKIIANEPFRATPELLYHAMLSADAYGSFLSGRSTRQAF